MNRHTRCIWLIAAFVGQAFIGCKKGWLNAKPSQSLAIPTTFQDFQALLDDNDYINEAWAPALAEIASDGHYMTDASFNGEPNNQKNAYTWSHTYTYPNLTIDWQSGYQKAYYANLVLEGLANITPMNSGDQQTWNDIEGQALFVRSMTFYEMAQQWAPYYDSSTAATDLGIPLRVSTDITIPTTRATVKENYDQLLSDMLTAKDFLPITPLYLSRASKPAAFAALARIYLSVSDYADALNYADSCLMLNNTLLDFNTVLPGNPVGQYNAEVLFQAMLQGYASLFPNTLIVDTVLYNSYDSNDLRRTVYFQLHSNGTTGFVGTYSNDVYLIFGGGGLAVDEVYLIRAECYARAGNVTAAMSDLNTLLQKRWLTGTFIPLTAANANDALSTILTERRKELFLRGLRWSDLRRLNRDPQFAVTLTRVVDGQTYTLSPNSYQYTLPLPDDIVEQTGIEQNPGW